MCAFSVGDIITNSARRYPHKPAVISEGRRVSYAELNDRANRLANALLEQGIKKGDRVAILFYNSPEFVESCFAVLKAGAVVVPLNFRLAGPELADMISDSDAAMLIYDAEFSQVISLIRPKLHSIRNYVAYHGDLIEASSSEEPGVSVGMDDGCAIFYTGGTSGFPKGAYKTHSNELWVAVGSLASVRQSYDDVVLAVAPLFHTATWEVLALPTLWLGNTLVVAKAFEPARIVEVIQKERVTITLLIPTMATAIWGLPDIAKHDLSSLRIYVSAGAVMPGELKRKILAYLPDVKFLDCYGSTEGGWITNLSPESAARKDACQGLPTFRARIVDEDGHDITRGEVGEVIVQSPAIMKEYYNTPEETQKAIKAGWFHTGDLARLDEEGYVYIVDRKKDMMISGGENIYSAEVERVICSHPKVLEAAVVGLPHEKWGEQVTAAVVLKPGEEMTESEVIAFCRQSIAGYKCPKRVLFDSQPLPRTPLGKISKKALREQLSRHPHS